MLVYIQYTCCRDSFCVFFVHNLYNHRSICLSQIVGNELCIFQPVLALLYLEKFSHLPFYEIVPWSKAPQPQSEMPSE